MSYSSDLLSGGAPEQEKKPGGYASALLDSEPSPYGGQMELTSLTDVDKPKDRETRATRELPELGEGGILAGEDPAQAAKFAAILAVTPGPEEIAQILPEMFPNIRITEDEGGNLIANNNATGVQTVINKPGVSQLDLVQMASAVAAFTPSAQAAAIPATVGKKMAAGAATAGLTQTGIEAAQEAAGGEFGKGDIALAGAAGGLAEGILPAAQKLRQRGITKKLNVEADELEALKPAIEEAEEASRRTGVTLYQAQKTAVPAQLEKQAFLSQLPASARKASQALKRQNQEAADAVNDFLASIAPPESVVTGAKKVRSAAIDAIEAKKLIRKEASSPIYKQAFRRQRQGKIGPIDTSQIEKKLKAMTMQFDPNDQIGVNLSKALKKISRAKGDLKKLHTAKIEIDQSLNSYGADSIGNTTKRYMLDIKNDLVSALTEQSPSYRAAMSEFRRTSPAVDVLEDSIIGKIAGIDDTQLKTVSRKLFDAAETNPQVMLNAKKIIKNQDPDAWNQIVRTELERRLGTAGEQVFAGEMVENIPGQLRSAIFGSGIAKAKQSRILYESVGKGTDTWKNLKYLEHALERASQGRATGSQTAAREEMKRELRGGFIQGIRRFFTQPVSTIAGVGEDAAFNRKTRALADAMFNPEWKASMKKIRKLNSSSPASVRAMAQLLTDIETSYE